MKLTIEIDDMRGIESYLSILSLGLLECLDKKIISIDSTDQILYMPHIIDTFEKEIPTLGRAIHLGTELEDVESIIPHKLDESIEQIRKLNFDSILSTYSNDLCVVYKWKGRKIYWEDKEVTD